MPSNDPSQLTLILVLVAIITICVILCIVKIQSELKDMNERVNYKLESMSKDLHRIADEVAPKDK
jgi:cell division protein ZapA (FtsZ GTPase activity inhibitor)